MTNASKLPAEHEHNLNELCPFGEYAAEGRALDIVAEARGVHESTLENDNGFCNRLRDEANGLLSAAIISIATHPDYRSTGPDLWERALDVVRKSARASISAIEMPLATPQELTELRLKLHGMGYHPVPIIGAHINDKAAGKRPTMTACQTKCLTADPHEIASWSRSQRNNTNTGILCGDVVGIDIDVLDVTLSANLVARAQELFGETPLRRIGRAPKILLLYRVETPHNKLATADLLFDDGSKAKVEILAEGQQFVAFGTHPDTRAPYHWPEKSPLDIAASDVPVVSLKTALIIDRERKAVAARIPYFHVLDGTNDTAELQRHRIHGASPIRETPSLSEKPILIRGDAVARAHTFPRAVPGPASRRYLTFFLGLAFGSIAAREASAIDRALRKRLKAIEQQLREGG